MENDKIESGLMPKEEIEEFFRNLEYKNRSLRDAVDACDIINVYKFKEEVDRQIMIGQRMAILPPPEKITEMLISSIQTGKLPSKSESDIIMRFGEITREQGEYYERLKKCECKHRQ